VWAIAEGLLEEAEPLKDLTGRVDVERRAVILGERRQRKVIAVERPVPIDEGAGSWDGFRGGTCRSLSQNEGALSFYLCGELTIAVVVRRIQGESPSHRT
jgi:hypothetical protein